VGKRFETTNVVLVPISLSMRYLDLILDAKWTFRDHFDHLFTSADRMVTALSRLMPNLGARMNDGDYMPEYYTLGCV